MPKNAEGRLTLLGKQPNLHWPKGGERFSEFKKVGSDARSLAKQI